MTTWETQVLKSLFQNSDDGFIVVDEKGGVQEINEEYASYFPKSRSEIIGHPIEETISTTSMYDVLNNELFDNREDVYLQPYTGEDLRQDDRRIHMRGIKAVCASPRLPQIRAHENDGRCLKRKRRDRPHRAQRLFTLYDDDLLGLHISGSGGCLARLQDTLHFFSSICLGSNDRTEYLLRASSRKFSYSFIISILFRDVRPLSNFSYDNHMIFYMSLIC